MTVTSLAWASATPAVPMPGGRRGPADSSSDADAMNHLAIALLRQGRQLDEARALAERAVAAGGERDSIYRATLAEVKAGALGTALRSRALTLFRARPLPVLMVVFSAPTLPVL